jgi:hypothetical protein
MADPTPAETMEGARLDGGRVRPARAEILRLQSTLLPALVAYQNDREGLTIPIPERFRYARTSLGKVQFPTVVIGARLESPTVAIRTQQKKILVSITALGEPIEVGEQWDDLWDIVELAARIMAKTKSGWKLPDSRPVWLGCKLDTISDVLPDYWREYAGVRAEFNINQTGLDLWEPA